jgi:hypothetical protein
MVETEVISVKNRCLNTVNECAMTSSPYNEAMYSLSAVNNNDCSYIQCIECLKQYPTHIRLYNVHSTYCIHHKSLYSLCGAPAMSGALTRSLAARLNRMLSHT